MGRCEGWGKGCDRFYPKIASQHFILYYLPLLNRLRAHLQTRISLFVCITNGFRVFGYPLSHTVEKRINKVITISTHIKLILIKFWKRLKETNVHKIRQTSNWRYDKFIWQVDANPLCLLVFLRDFFRLQNNICVLSIIYIIGNILKTIIKY